MVSWYQAKTKRIDLEKFGAKGLYVVFSDMSSLPYGEARAIQKKFDSLDKDNPTQDQAEEVLKEVIPLIIEWNVTDPKTGEALKQPEKVEDFDALPMEVLMHILNGGFSSEDPLDEKKSNTPEPTS